MLTHRTGMVTRKPDHQREHEGNRNTIAQGMPALPCEPVVTNLCAFSNRTQGCGCAQAPGIPCALFLRGTMPSQRPGCESAAGMPDYVIASAAKQSSLAKYRFWIASAFAQGRFGGLSPRVARIASEEGSSRCS